MSCSKRDEPKIEIGRKEENELPETLGHKVNKIREIITVEPLIGFYQLANVLSKPALDALEFESACRVNLGYNDTICNAVVMGNYRNFSTENNNIQVVISKMHSWQQPVQSFVPLLLILFLGSYSDRHKWRKPFFLFPIVADLLGNVGCILCVVNVTTWPLEAQGIFRKIVPSLCGSQTLIMIATTAYVADISTTETRTFRIGITTIVISVTSVLGNLASGILFSKLGYEGALSLSSSMSVLALIYGVFWVKETRIINKDANFNMLTDVFNPAHAVDTFKILFKKNQPTSQLYAMLLLVTLYRSANDGDIHLLYLYVQNVFQWTVIDYTYFQTAGSVLTLIGNIVGLGLFVKILGIGDLVILFITVVSKIISNVIYGCAKTSLVFYIGTFTGILTKLNRTSKRSYSTKIVSKEDIGKTQSLVCFAEALSPMIAGPLYNLIYVHTLKTFPATVLFFSVLLYGICCCLILWMYYKTKNNDETNENFEGQDQHTTHI